MKKVKSYRGTGFPPNLWNIKCPIVEHMSKSHHQSFMEPTGQNNDVSHDRQPLIRLTVQIWPMTYRGTM